MEDPAIDIGFDHDGKKYMGWARPSKHLKRDGKPKSYHVVLNGTLFGNVSARQMDCGRRAPRGAY